MLICPCCGDGSFASQQQLRRHLAARQRRLRDALDVINKDNGGLAPHNAEPAHHGDDPPPQEDGPAPRLGSPALSELAPDNDRPRRRGVDLAGLIAREDEDGLGNEMDLDDEDGEDGEDGEEGNGLFAPLPDLPPALEARRFPRVIIEDWHSDEEDAQDFAPPESDIDDESVGSDRDPEFDEEEDGPQGAGANAARQRRLRDALDVINKDNGGLAPHNAEPAHHGDDPPPQEDGPAPRLGSPALSELAPDNDRPRRHGVDLAGLIAREDEDG
ncbi:hypothetical protein BDV93DRAFT_564801 [Ceratobasidium sp. AG-I]|nr:hypothetical protein BDV93DRAFT_564801 [Ceratobasidium sp. AG-I]